MVKSNQKSGFVKKELLLIRPLIKEPWKSLTREQLKEAAKNRSNNYVNTALGRFVRSGILLMEPAGKVSTYRLDAENTGKLHYLSLAEYMIKDERPDLPHENMLKIMEKLKSPFYIMLVCGSYAEGRQKPSSDIDVAVIIPDSEPKRPYEIALKEGELMVPEVHGHVFTQEELYLMLTNDEFNYGKELARKHIILHGAEQYYNVLFKAMRHGFKG